MIAKTCSVINFGFFESKKIKRFGYGFHPSARVKIWCFSQ